MATLQELKTQLWHLANAEKKAKSITKREYDKSILIANAKGYRKTQVEKQIQRLREKPFSRKGQLTTSKQVIKKDKYEVTILKSTTGNVPQNQIRNALKKIDKKNIYISYEVRNNDGTVKKISRKVTDQDYYSDEPTPDYIPGRNGTVKITSY